ncbi:MAG: transglycosylase SLT domain-containing protein, partial [Gemmatimonadota bacterium]
MTPPPRSARVGIRSIPAGLVTAFLLASCQTVGGVHSFRSSAAPGSASVAAEAEWSTPTAAPVETIPRVEVRVEGLDAILHSAAGVDPAFQSDVRDWMRSWTTGQASSFERYLQRMREYDGLVLEELLERGLPGSLRYLPIVESGYIPSAVSRVGATGLWQLMDPTARELGLTVSSIVDDRRDPVASTHAALEYLEALHVRFDSWFLALAAYNAGPNRVQRLLDRYAPGEGSGDESYFEILPHLPAETRQFVPRFFAAATLASDRDTHGFEASTEGTVRFDEVAVPDATSLDVVARAAGVEEASILALNPQYLRGFTPAGETRIVRVPEGRAARFARNFAEIPPEERLTVLEHVVTSGETFTHIARRYGVPVSDLTDMNGSVDPRRLQIGMRLVVPVGGVDGDT